MTDESSSQRYRINDCSPRGRKFNLLFLFEEKTQEEKRRPTNVAKILCDFVLLVSDRQIKICLKSNNLCMEHFCVLFKESFKKEESHLLVKKNKLSN
jgi:hypothetical protein